MTHKLIAMSTVNTCGHPDRKHDAKGMCASCYQAAWAKAHPESNSGNGWLKRHPEEARLHSRRLNLKRRGTTPEEYDQLWIEQNG